MTLRVFTPSPHQPGAEEGEVACRYCGARVDRLDPDDDVCGVCAFMGRRDFG